MIAKRNYYFKRLYLKHGGFDMKSRSSKLHIFLFVIESSLSNVLTRCRYCPPEYGCLLMVVRGTWNFVRHPATLAQGSASEAHMNMDVNLCRLPVIFLFLSKCLSAPCRGIHICAEAGEYFAVYTVWILHIQVCWLIFKYYIIPLFC